MLNIVKIIDLTRKYTEFDVKIEWFFERVNKIALKYTVITFKTELMSSEAYEQLLADLKSAMEKHFLQIKIPTEQGTEIRRFYVGRADRNEILMVGADGETYMS